MMAIEDDIIRGLRYVAGSVGKDTAVRTFGSVECMMQIFFIVFCLHHGIIDPGSLDGYPANQVGVLCEQFFILRKDLIFRCPALFLLFRLMELLCQPIILLFHLPAGEEVPQDQPTADEKNDCKHYDQDSV